MDNFANFMFTQMFKAAAPENIRRLLSHKDQTRLTVEDAYKVYFTNHRMEMDKKSNTVVKLLVREENFEIYKVMQIQQFSPPQIRTF